MTPFVRRPNAPVHEPAGDRGTATLECASREDAASDVHLRAVSAPTSGSSRLPDSAKKADQKTRVLLVDDDPMVLRSIGRVLRQRGYEVTTATNGEDATLIVDNQSFDVVLSDIAMPGMDGIQFLREVREHDLSVPVVLITGAPTVSTAVQALELGAFNYLTKPIAMDDVERVIEKAARMHRMARVTQQAAELLGHTSALGADRAGLEASYERAIQSLWIAYQPILRATDGGIFGYEALLRSGEATLPHPGAVIDAAERLARLEELGRTIRDLATSPVAAAADRGILFVNLHVTDLLDSALYSPEAATLPDRSPGRARDHRAIRLGSGEGLRAIGWRRCARWASALRSTTWGRDTPASRASRCSNPKSSSSTCRWFATCTRTTPSRRSSARWRACRRTWECSSSPKASKPGKSAMR